MPIITWTDSGSRPRRTLVPNESLSDWLATRQSRGGRIDRIDFADTERAGIVLATPGVDQLTELQLLRSDLGMARVVEDLFEALKARTLLTDDDLPAESLARITDRQAKREALR
ncbi:MAG: hypothetical protein JJU36_11900 [Phycisphaeraceae bacterium]|nr:hypothetical protein [Phycisphaeraceae bacterium]